MSIEALNAVTDKVLAHQRAPTGPLKVIAGAPDHPLVIDDIEIPCYVLEDETRVLSQQGFLEAIGRAPKAKGGQGAQQVDQLPAFVSASNLKPFIHADFARSTTSIPFQISGGHKAYGYPAQLLPEVCNVYLKAREAGRLLPGQEHIAARAEILIRGLATIGIIALVDEATGYQHIREERALVTILERFIADDLRPWTKTFPIEFYQELFRLRGWDGSAAVKRPSVIGHYTNNFVYERIAPGVLAELRKRNPTLPQGWRRNRHHQWFTADHGHPKLKEHIAAVIALMRAAPSWNAFKKSIDIAFPQTGHTISMALDDDVK